MIDFLISVKASETVWSVDEEDLARYRWVPSSESWVMKTAEQPRSTCTVWGIRSVTRMGDSERDAMRVFEQARQESPHFPHTEA